MRFLLASMLIVTMSGCSAGSQAPRDAFSGGTDAVNPEDSPEIQEDSTKKSDMFAELVADTLPSDVLTDPATVGEDDTTASQDTGTQDTPEPSDSEMQDTPEPSDSETQDPPASPDSETPDASSDSGLDTSQADLSPPADGTPEHPFLIPLVPGGPEWEDWGDTSKSSVFLHDLYPPNTVDECGPEVYYFFSVSVKIAFSAFIDAPEPDGVDVDLHLLSSLDPLVLITRGHYEVHATLEPGNYWLVMDTYCKNGQAFPGPYHLHVGADPWFDGTFDDSVPLGVWGGDPLVLPFAFNDIRNTANAKSDAVDVYPPSPADESGPEFVYTFTVAEPVRFMAFVEAPEPDGTDIDLHLLSSVNPLVLVSRNDKALYEILEPGTYWLVLDSYAGKAGPYALHLAVRPRTPAPGDLFNPWILEAVDWLYANYGLLGYDSAVLTHDVPYGSEGVVPATDPPRTMCVAAVMEVILTAMNLYAQETDDASVFKFLPKTSWQTLKGSSIKAHIWVNPDLEAGGTADALRHFGMGYNVPFEELTPGSFANINRTTGTGHAVVFLGFLDASGKIHDTYPTGKEVIGFKYFSSQGGYDAGKGGLDFRVAIFEEYGNPTLPGVPFKKDLHVIRSNSQVLLNTGVMLTPKAWLKLRGPTARCGEDCPESTFDSRYFDPDAAG